LSDGYFRMLDTEVGPAALQLNLTLATWAGDGLPAIFLLVAGLELKREFVALTNTTVGHPGRVAATTDLPLGEHPDRGAGLNQPALPRQRTSVYETRPGRT